MRTLTMALILLLGVLPSITVASVPIGTKAEQNTYHLGVSSLGMTFKELLSHFDYDSTDEDEGVFWVSKNGGPLFGLNDKNGLHDKVAWSIDIISPGITTDGDVHVGMSVKELLRKFPNLSLNIDEDNLEYFAPPTLENGTKNNPDAKILIYVSKDNNLSLANINPGKYPTKKFSHDGLVKHILVFVTGNRPLISAKPTLSK